MNALPYPGLRPFCRDETDIFFGREEHVDQLLEKLGTSHFLAVIGPSGCGKSSLVRAGLIGGLETGFLASAGARWRVAEMRPGDRPMRRLAEVLLGDGGLGAERAGGAEAEAFLLATLGRGPLGLVEVLRETPLPPHTNLLLLVDQFEEIFRYRKEGNRDEADAFVSLLLESASQSEAQIYVVITMRSDFLGHCTVFTDLPEALNNSAYLTPRLTREQRRAAIIGPARVFGGDIEPVLVNRLLNDMGADPDQLPLMQHVLMRMWTHLDSDAAETYCDMPRDDVAENERGGRRLTLADYMAVGGLAEALSRHADEAYLELDSEGQRIAEVMFRRLSEGDTRRPVPLSEVAAVADVQPAAVHGVVEVFRRPDRSFVTPRAGEALYDDSVLDISHESLIRRWTRLNEWSRQEASSGVTYYLLEQTARLWKAGQAALWGTPDLENALAWKERERPTSIWAERYGGNFALASQFLQESERQRRTRQAEEEAAREREFLYVRSLAEARQLQAEAERQRAQEQQLRAEEQAGANARLRVLSVALSVVFLVALVLAVSAWAQKNVAIDRAQDAERTQKKAENAQKNAEKAQEDAKKEAARAEKATQLAEKERKRAETEKSNAVRARDIALRASKNAEQEKVRAQSLAKEELLARRTADDMRTKAEQETRRSYSHELAAAAVANLDTDPELGVLLAREAIEKAKPDDGIARKEAERALRQAVETSRVTRTLSGHKGQISAIAFSSHWVSAASIDGSVKAWDLRSGQEPFSLPAPQSEVYAAAFSPKGEYIVTADSEGRIAIWNAMNGQALVPWRSNNQKGSVIEVAVNPKTDNFVSAASNGSIKFWDFQGRELGTLQAHTGSVEAVNFSQDGESFATGSSEGDVAIWDARFRDLNHRRLLPFSDVKVADLAFSPPPHGNRLAVAGNEKVTVFDTKSGDEMFSIEVPDKINKIAYSPDGTQLVIVGAFGTELWDVQGGGPKLLYKNDVGEVLSAAFSMDGERLATGDAEGKILIWNVKDPQTRHELPGNDRRQVWAVAFSPNSQSLLSVSQDAGVQLWDVGGQRSLFDLPRSPLAVTELVFSSNGKTLAISGSNAVTVCSLEPRPSCVRPLSGTRIVNVSQKYWGTWIRKVAFDQSERCLLILTSDGAVSFWSIETDQIVRAAERFPAPQNRAVAFHPQAKKIASVFGDSGEYALKVTGEIDKGAVDLPDQGINEIEVNRLEFDSSAKYLAVGYRSGLVKLWNLESQKVMYTAQGHTNGIQAIRFSPDSKLFATAAADNTARVWDTASGRELLILRGHAGWVTSLAFSQDGGELVTGDQRGSVRVWSLSLMYHEGSVRRLALSQDGKFLATAGEDQVAKVWKYPSGEFAYALIGHKGALWDVKFSPDGTRIATASEDKTGRIWDAKSHNLLFTIPYGEIVRSVAFDSTGSRLALGGDNGFVMIWNVSKPDCLGLLGQLSVAGDEKNAEILMNSAENGCLNVLRSPGNIEAIKFDPMGNRIVTGNDAGDIWIWDLNASDSKPVCVIYGHGGRVNYMAFNPESTLLATASDDQTAKVWDVSPGVDCSTSAPLWTISGHAGTVKAIVFSHDGKKLATASFDGTTKLWDLQSRTESFTLHGHTNQVRDVVFGPDDTTIATCSEDNTIRIHTIDLNALEEVARARSTRQFTPEECKEYLHGNCPISP
ncbi:MAG TPA: hypothetical protein VGP73_06765 [Thermoanaerobaculia bacterium]